MPVDPGSSWVFEVQRVGYLHIPMHCCQGSHGLYEVIVCGIFKAVWRGADRYSLTAIVEGYPGPWFWFQGTSQVRAAPVQGPGSVVSLILCRWLSGWVACYLGSGIEVSNWPVLDRDVSIHQYQCQCIYVCVRVYIYVYIHIRIYVNMRILMFSFIDSHDDGFTTLSVCHYW